jgi:hypothetical protein
MTQEQLPEFNEQPEESRHKKSSRLQAYFEQVEQNEPLAPVDENAGGSLAYADECTDRPAYLDVDKQLHAAKVQECSAAEYLRAWSNKPDYDPDITSAKLSTELVEIFARLGLDAPQTLEEEDSAQIGFVIANFYAIVDQTLPRPGRSDNPYAWYCRAIRCVESMPQTTPEHMDDMWGELETILSIAMDGADDHTQSQFMHVYEDLEKLMYATAKVSKDEYFTEITEQKLKRRIEGDMRTQLMVQARDSQLFVPETAYGFLSQAILCTKKTLGLYDCQEQLAELATYITDDAQEQAGIDAEWNYIHALQALATSLQVRDKKVVSNLFAKVKRRLHNCFVLTDADKTDVLSSLRTQRRLGRVYLGRQAWHPRTQLPLTPYVVRNMPKNPRADARRNYVRRRT